MTRSVRTRRIHAWDLTIAQVVQLQAQLASEVIRRTTFPMRCARRVAGVDIHYAAERAVVAAVVLGFLEREPLAQATASVPAVLPLHSGAAQLSRPASGCRRPPAARTGWHALLLNQLQVKIQEHSIAFRGR